ncbi:hypothetical protein F9K33_07895 [bacterium]|nr:MAG: hypothetical protein F9K33_07895 [bacterium]
MTVTQEFNTSVEEVLKEYKKQSLPLFDYLNQRSQIGFTQNQFQIYRDNYFYRTFRTIPSVCLIVKSAAENEDEAVMKSAGQNLMEELGLINGTTSHSAHLRHSHNIHSERVFKLSPISLRESLSSELVLEKTKEFSRQQAELYASDNYLVVLATNYAQEEVATDMLKSFLSAWFRPYKFLYSLQEYDEVEEYFRCHIDGLEERHAEDAKNSVIKQIKTSQDMNIALTSIRDILVAQSNMWVSLYEGIASQEQTSRLVPITVI